MQWVSGKELAGLQTPAALALEDQYPQRLAATGHHNAGLVGLHHLAGRACAVNDFRVPYLQQVRLGMAGKVTKCPGPGHQAARVRGPLGRPRSVVSLLPN